MARVIVLDASVLIAHLDATDRHHGRAGRLLGDATEHTLRASPVTVAEVLVGPARAGNLERGVAVLEEMQVVQVPLAAEASAQLASLRASTNLKLPDCCVLLAALATEVRLATFDDRLAASASDLGMEVWTS